MRAIDLALVSVAGVYYHHAPPSEPAAHALIAAMRNLSLSFLRDSATQEGPKHTSKHAFRDSLIRCMSNTALLEWPGYELHERDYRGFADILLAGSLLYAAIAKQDRVTLGARLAAKLGPAFLRRTADPHERARDVLLATGIARKAVWNLLDSAEAQRKARASKKPPVVKGRRGSV